MLFFFYYSGNKLKEEVNKVTKLIATAGKLSLGNQRNSGLQDNLTPCKQTPLNHPHAFRTRESYIRYIYLVSILAVGAVVFTLGLLLYNNPVAVTSPSFGPVVQRRLNALIAMGIGAVCQGVATLAFQTVTNNRIITPSLLGFEALYSVIQTSLLFFGGLQVLLAFNGAGAFLLQVGLMVGLSLILYGSLLNSARQNLQLLLLVGIVLGTSMRSLATFIRRLLEPTEFDILQARLFASVNNADAESFPIAILLVVVALVWLLTSSNCMNTMRLGPDVAVSLGVKYRYCEFKILTIVSILMSVSTALLGPITFLGFLAATLTYQLVSTYDHRYQFPVVILLSYCVLTGAYFLMFHVFSAQGVVTLIIELVGGLTFLALLMKRGKA